MGWAGSEGEEKGEACRAAGWAGSMEVRRVAGRLAAYWEEKCGGPRLTKHL